LKAWPNSAAPARTSRGVTGSGVSNGANGGVPAVNGDVASPSILAASSLADQTGEFVRYGANGFEKGIYSIATDLNLATPADVFDATTNQNILVSANPFALVVRANRAISGGALTIGSGSQPATVILDQGTISTTALDFGTREAIVFAGTTGQSVISAPNHRLRRAHKAGERQPAAERSTERERGRADCRRHDHHAGGFEQHPRRDD
jgi:hypothetical protein